MSMIGEAGTQFVSVQGPHGGTLVPLLCVRESQQVSLLTMQALAEHERVHGIVGAGAKKTTGTHTDVEPSTSQATSTPCQGLGQGASDMWHRVAGPCHAGVEQLKVALWTALG